MKKIVFVIAAIIVVASCSGISSGIGKKTEIKDMKDSLSYCIGLSMANYLKNIEDQLNTEINLEVFGKAVNDLLKDEDLDIPLEQVDMIGQMIQQKLMMEVSMKSKKEGQDFLIANKEKEGIKTTESGLQYEIIKQGNGPKPTENDMVSVHYKGTMTDGTQFDSSYENGEPVKFEVTRVIKGWTEALLMMPVGSKWKLYIPSELGYGERPPRGSNIKPNSVLIFEIELLDIEKSDK